MPTHLSYHEDFATASSNLDLVLSLMTNHPAAPNPLTFAVWYVYVARLSPPLTDAVNAILNVGGKLSDQLVREIHERYIERASGVEELEQAAAGAEATMQNLLRTVARTAETSNDQIERFAQSLALHNQKLIDCEARGGVEGVLHGMSHETRLMREAVSKLREELQQSANEIKLLQEALHKARAEAVTDSLTGLANRKGFNEELTRWLDAGRDATVPLLSLVMIDIDHFKRINDRHGHLTGDKVLRAVGHALRTHLRDGDFVARYGGEEFSVLLPDTDLEAAIDVAEKLREAIGEGRIQRRKSEVPLDRVTVSMGVAMLRDGETATDFVGRADAALYLSKMHGRNRVTIDDGEATLSRAWG